MATEVTGLVIDAMLKMVSFVIGRARQAAADAERLVVEDAVGVDDGDDDAGDVTAIGRALEEGGYRGRALRRKGRGRREDRDDEQRKKAEQAFHGPSS